MRRFLSRSALSAILAAMLRWPAAIPAGAAVDKKPLTAGDLWRLKAVGEPQLSPDGRWIAYALTVTDLEKNSRNADIWLMLVWRRRAAAPDDEREEG